MPLLALFRRPSSVALTFVLLITVPRPALGGLIYGCTNSKGRISKIGTTPPSCGSQKTLISWSQQGVPGASANLAISDATGRSVGTFTGSIAADPCPANVIVKADDGTLVGLPVGKTGVLSCSTSGLLHTTSDCSGDRYLPLGNLALASTAQVYGGSAYYAVDRPRRSFCKAGRFPPIRGTAWTMVAPLWQAGRAASRRAS